MYFIGGLHLYRDRIAPAVTLVEVTAGVVIVLPLEDLHAETAV